ncbi:phosphatidylinositolglycan class A protein, putative [Eimeria necatrix]|uniref:phosphatidylinositol N-acetylglucosaminyltransferase n=1 Tax=Eimeria necatrix TaxID=51315 RepID=U6MI87_9EIME|nr:phosphatidylinositolglycan class A protein, putative [Eimeria necatrix]CDJ63731.1 phosphatidylinositolglycan class A protein, putative [Eimeria necatrix]
MALRGAGEEGSSKSPAMDVCYAAGPTDDREYSGCCCCHCSCSCCCSGRGGGCGRAARAVCAAERTGSSSSSSSSSSNHSRFCSEAATAASSVHGAADLHRSASREPPQSPQQQAKALDATQSTTAATSCSQNSPSRESEDAAANEAAASRSFRGGCGAPNCFLANSIRPKRLCICMVSDFFFPSLGGVEMHIYELSVRLARKGFKVVVVTHAIDGRHGIRYLTEGIKVYYLPITCFHDRSTLVTFFTTLPLIRTVLIREKVDIVHGHQTTSTLAHESMFHARHLGYRVVYTDHSMFSFADAACIHMNKIFKFFLTHCDHCICVSHTHKENLVLRGALNPHQIAVINNAVDVPAYVPDLSKRPPPPAINILILSRLSYRKGIDLLVDIIPAVCAKYPNVTFIIGGDGPKRIILEEMREKHRIHDRVEMLGAIPHGQACSFLQRGQIFLNASLTESFCIAIVEAAACGLVVVSTDVGGIPEVLPPDMVRLASPNPAALTLQLEEAIRQVERGDVDPHALHQRVLEMYSWEDVADRVEQVYFSALFDLPMSAHLRKGISLANVPLPPNPPPLPTSQGSVKVLRALNRCGPFSGKFFALVAVVDWCLIRLVEWLFPRDSIEEAASFPSDVLYSVKTNLPSPT